jgi:DNA polymerase I-like protein with 3'-5' exonuclease and polymerase domains/uracil-DNA glycosylase
MNRGYGSSPSKIMIVGEIYSQDDFHKQEPFSGNSGIEFNRMLHEAHIMRSECYLTNVVNGRPPNGTLRYWLPKRKTEVQHGYHTQHNGEWVSPEILKGFAQLCDEIAEVQPNVIVACGDLPLWLLTGASGVDKWRGSVLTARNLPEANRPKVIPTYHPSTIFPNWSRRAVSVMDLLRVREHSASREPPEFNWKFTVRPSFTTVTRILQELLARAEVEDFWLDFDLETRAGHIACAGISWTDQDALCIPFMCVEDDHGYWHPEAETEIVYLLYKLLAHKRVKVRGQNLLYDAQYTYRHWHFVPNVAQDTMITHHTVFAGLPKSLAFQSSIYSPQYIYWKDDGKTWERAVGEDQLWAYNCQDCVRTREVGEASAASVSALGLESVEAFQQRFFYPVLKAMQRGVRIDKNERAKIDARLELELASREKWLSEVIGHKLNVKSPKQMKTFFYEDLALRPVLKRDPVTKMMKPTCDDHALETLALREPILRPIVRRIQEYRSISVILNTFIRMPLDVDGRMRTSYNICGTETYRLNSSENAFGSGGNLQNWSKGGTNEETGLVMPNTRTLVIPDPGYEFFDTDLSKADLRVVIWESDESEMKAMLAEGRDPYIETAREFYRDPTITKKLPNGDENPKYKTFKGFAHGTHYLGTPIGLAQRMGLTIREAERTQAWYFGKYPKIKEWQGRFIEQVKRTKKVTNAFGYTRSYFDRISDETCRAAIAWLPQSTVACVINRVWQNLYDNAPYIQVLLQTHDSLSGQFPTHRRDQAIADFSANSSIIVPYSDPLTIPIELKTGSSWGEC